MTWRHRLGPAALAGLSAVVLTALIGYKSWREHDTAIDGARAQTQSFASALEEQSRQTLHRVASTLRQADDLLAELRKGQVTEPADVGRHLAEQLPADRLIHAFAVLDSAGRVVVSTSTVPQEAAAQGAPLPDYHAPHVRGADREVVFGAPRQLSPQGDWLLPMSRRLTLPGGAWDGVLVAWVRPQYLQGFYDTLLGGRARARDGIVALFITSGWAAVTSPRDDAAMRRNWSDTALFREHLPQWPTGTVRGRIGHDPIDRIYSYRVLNEYPVVVSYGLASDAVLAAWRRSAAWDALLLALALAVLGVGAWALARREQGLQEAERAHAQMLAAQEASRAKTEFLARMSHELRTPLNAVFGFAQLLEDDAGSLSRERQQHLRLLREGAQHLQALVSDVMDVASIEAGRLEVARHPVPVAQVVESSVAMYAGAAAAAGVRLESHLPEGAPVNVTADATRLRQVLANLVSNGIKYNHPGGHVVVTAARAGDTVRLEVEDDGLGMTDEQQRQLFTPYDRLGREGGTARGTGIGLVLVRQLVTLMNGRLEIRSEAERGTRVTIELPFSHEGRLEPTAAPAPLAADARGNGLVLYIEDEPVNRLLVQETLRTCPGVELLLAESGHEGLSLARARQPGLVLLDMQLPDIDGAQVLAALRGDPATRRIPVVVLSASAMSTDVERARVAGAAAYWTKPIDVALLRTQVQRMLASVEA